MVYHISNLRLMKKKYDYNTLLLKFENENKIFEEYDSSFFQMKYQISFTDKYKSLLDEYEEEYKTLEMN